MPRKKIKNKTKLRPKSKPVRKKRTATKSVKVKKTASTLIKSSNKEIEKGLKSIYQDDKGKMPKMTGLEIKEKNRTLKTVILLALTLAVLLFVAFVGFLVFQPSPKFTGKKINLEIKAPFTVVSGENISYEIKYTNQEEISLTNSELIVYLPHGFIYENANIEPEVKENQTPNIKIWELGNINQKQSDTLIINGKLIGDLNSTQTISAGLSYLPANFSSEFQKNISFNTAISDSLIDIELEYPNQTASLDETEFSLNIINNSDEIDLKYLEVELNYPPQFTLLASQISKERGQDSEMIKEEINEDEIPTQKIWQIDELLFNTQNQIKFIGNFEVDETASFDLNLKLKLKGSDDSSFVQREEDITVNVIKGELLTNLIIQGSNQNKAVNFEDSLNYLLTIQNKSKNTVGDLKVRAVLDSKLLDWSSLDDSYSGRRDDIQILWTKDQIADLALLFPEEEVEISFKIDLKSFQEAKRYSEDDFVIKSFFETQINKIDTDDTDIIIESNAIINNVNTDLDFDVYARYFDDENHAVGSGPLPPVIGQKTKYKIFWQIDNSLHEIKNVELKAKLPGYVKFEGNEKTSAGNLFLNQSNEIVWQISRMPTSIDSSTSSFEISITPGSADALKILNLLSEIKLTVVDSVTNTRIAKSLSGITTNLDGDPLAEGKGLVQE
jgi:hypothetical protein